MPVILVISLPIIALLFMSWGISFSSTYHADANQSFWQGFWQYLTGKTIARQILGTLHSLFSQALSHAMGVVAEQFDNVGGVYFHALADTAKGIGDLATLTSAFAISIGQLVTGQVGWKEVQQAIASVRTELRAEVHKADVAIEREIAHEKAQLRSVAHGITPRLRAAEHGLEHVLQPEIAGLRERVKTLEDEAIHSAKWLKKHEKSLAAGTFAGAVAWALGHLGLGWTRCSSNPFNNNPKACSLWGDLARFLPLLGFLVAAFDFADFVKAAETVAEGIGSAVASIEGTFDVSLPPLPPPQT